MEAHKENLILKIMQNKTRIPVPVEPLPLLPSYLINKTNEAREPLKTIHFSNTNDATSSSQTQKDQELKIDKKVTLKITSTVNSGWAQNVFSDEVETVNKNTMKGESDNSEDGTVIKENESTGNDPKEVLIATGEVICDYKEPHVDHNTAFIVCESDNASKPVLFQDEHNLHIGNIDNTVVTPNAVIEHRGVRNVKKSLKRPHSRELQGFSPAVRVGIAEDKVKRRLIFDRFENRLSSYCGMPLHMVCLDKEYSLDIFSYLLTVERNTAGVPYIPSLTRACLINWLIKVHGSNDNPAVIQSACWYFDSYLSLKQVNIHEMQVVVAACYWIAQKLHGCTYSSAKLVAFGDNAFTGESLRATESMVLRELKFPLLPVVPQDYISYLSWFCDERRRHSEIEMAATFLCMAGLIMDRSMCKELPSAIAAASMKTAVRLLGTRNVMNRLLMCPIYQKCVEKFTNLDKLSQYIHHAARIITGPSCQFDVLRNLYSLPPYLVTQKIIAALK